MQAVSELQSPFLKHVVYADVLYFVCKVLGEGVGLLLPCIGFPRVSTGRRFLFRSVVSARTFRAYDD